MNASSLVQGIVKLVSLPEVYYRIDAMIKDPYANLADMATLIGSDPGLSTRLLRIANSAMFSFPSHVDSINRAITIIGTKQLRDLVLATSVIDIFKGIPQEQIDMEAYWRHCIATGMTARAIATARREPNVEHYYVAGLLHDIGRLIMFMEIPHKSHKAMLACQETHEQLHIVEKETIGFNHAEVGGELAVVWDLPEALRESIAFHHTPGNAEQFPHDAAIVHVADIISNIMAYGSGGERVVPQLETLAWQRVEVEANKLPEIMQQVENQYHDAVEFFLEDN